MKRFLPLLIIAFSCKTPQKIAEQQAQKERDYIRQLQGKQGEQPILAFPITVPGGMIVKTVSSPCPDFDSGAVRSRGGKLTITANCPPINVNADSIVRNSAGYKSALLAWRGELMRADSLQRDVYQVTNERDTALSNYRQAMKWLSIIGAIAAVYLLFNTQFGFLTGLFKRFIK